MANITSAELKALNEEYAALQDKIKKTGDVEYGLTALLKDRVANIGKMVSGQQALADATKKTNELAEEYKAAQEELVKTKEQIVKLDQEQAEIAQAQIDAVQEIAQLEQDALNARVAGNQQAQEQAEILLQSAKQQQRERVRRQAAITKELANARAQQAVRQRDAKDSKKALDDQLKKQKQIATVVKVIHATVVATNAVLTSGVGIIVTIATAFFDIIKEILQMNQMIRDNARSFAMQTGESLGVAMQVSQKSRQMHLQYHKLWTDEAAYANDMAEAVMKRGDASLSLSASFSKSLLVLRAGMGATAGEAESLYHYFDQIGGKSGAAVEMAGRMYNFGRANKIAGGFIKTQLVENLDLFAKHGKDAGGVGMRVFKGLTAAAKQTGLSVKQLADAFGIFDDFETGLESANKINQMFGTNLNTLALMAQTEEQRKDTIVEQIKARYGSMDSMNRYQRTFLAKTFSMSVDQMEALIKGEPYKDPAQQTADALRSNAESVAKDSKDIAHNMKKLLAKLMPLFERIATALENFVDKLINDPNSPLNKFLDWVMSSSFQSTMERAFDKMLFAVDALVGGFGDLMYWIGDKLNMEGLKEVGNIFKGGLGEGIMNSALITKEMKEQYKMLQEVRSGKISSNVGYASKQAVVAVSDARGLANWHDLADQIPLVNTFDKESGKKAKQALEKGQGFGQLVGQYISSAGEELVGSSGAVFKAKMQQQALSKYYGGGPGAFDSLKNTFGGSAGYHPVLQKMAFAGAPMVGDDTAFRRDQLEALTKTASLIANTEKIKAMSLQDAKKAYEEVLFHPDILIREAASSPAEEAKRSAARDQVETLLIELLKARRAGTKDTTFDNAINSAISAAQKANDRASSIAAIGALTAVIEAMKAKGL